MGKGLAQWWERSPLTNGPGFDSWTRRHMWVEFVGFLPCSENFFPGDPVYHSPQETNISKFQLDLDICQALNHEPLARVIAQALPVFDIYFYIYFTVFLCEVWYDVHTSCDVLPFEYMPLLNIDGWLINGLIDLTDWLAQISKHFQFSLTDWQDKTFRQRNC